MLVGSDRFRWGAAKRIGGGVLILAHHVEKTDEFVGAEIAHLYLLLTGVLLSPKLTGKITLTDPGKPSADARNPPARAPQLHIVAGDFNATARVPLFDEWCRVARMWRLNDRSAPSVHTGSSIDKVLFLPGRCARFSFSPVDRERELSRDGGLADFSAATVAPELALSDHFPILSPAPRAVGRPNFTNYTLNVAGKAGEDWVPRNNNLIYTLGE